MSNIPKLEKAVDHPDDSLLRRAMGRVSGILSGQTLEAISFFDAPDPELPLASVLDGLDDPYDAEMIASQMSHIAVRRTQE